mmetsp:Transcript_15447/g.36501  ORF Transcript_15447/g.36501 Transcript_15447/m.36501 type:complete len:269 (+) Transcript_15447:473-1279(+)
MDVDEGQQLARLAFRLKGTFQRFGLRGRVIMVVPVKVHGVQVGSGPSCCNTIRVEHGHQKPCNLAEAALCLWVVAQQKIQNPSHDPRCMRLARMSSCHDAGARPLASHAQRRDLLAAGGHGEALLGEAAQVRAQVRVSVGHGICEKAVVLLEGKTHVERDAKELPGPSETARVVRGINAFSGPCNARRFHSPFGEEDRLTPLFEKAAGLYEVHQMESVQLSGAHLPNSEAKPLDGTSTCVRKKLNLVLERTNTCDWAKASALEVCIQD